jgi:hypothetical protein
MADSDEYLCANPSVKGGVDIMPLLVCVRPGGDLEQQEGDGRQLQGVQGQSPSMAAPGQVRPVNFLSGQYTEIG